MGNLPEGQSYLRQTFTILTTEANATLSGLHDRMPVVLDRTSWVEWLDPKTRVEAAQALLLPADDADFHAYPVTPQVGRCGSKARWRICRCLSFLRVKCNDLLNGTETE